MDKDNYMIVGIPLIVIGIVAIGLLAMGLTDTNITVYEENQIVNSMNVNGTSNFYVSPDLAKITAGISVVRSDAYDAQQAENIVINNIVEALLDLGLDEEDMETSQLSLYEETRWIKEEYVHMGWRATQMLTISTQNLDIVGQILDVAVDNGANEIQGVTFTLTPEKRTEQYEIALELAGEDAKTKAEAIADGLGIDVGDVLSVSESGVSFIAYDYREYSKTQDSSPAPTTVMIGDVSVSASVTVSFQID